MSAACIVEAVCRCPCRAWDESPYFRPDGKVTVGCVECRHEHSLSGGTRP